MISEQKERSVARFLAHIRSNLVGYLALFVALGGTSYAAFDLPNHSVQPVKLDSRSIGGYVRAWASVAANGRAIASTGKPTIKVQQSVPPGDYIILWHTKPITGCTAVANVDARGVGGSGPLPGYALPVTGEAGSRGQEAFVHTYNAQGAPAALPFDVALLCSTPR